MKLETEDKRLISGVAATLSRLVAIVAISNDLEKYEEKMFETLDFLSDATVAAIANKHGVDADEICKEVKERIDTELSLTVLKVMADGLEKAMEDEE